MVTRSRVAGPKPRKAAIKVARKARKPSKPRPPRKLAKKPRKRLGEAFVPRVPRVPRVESMRERAARIALEQARALALAIARVGLDHRALNVEIIDVRGKVDYSDYVVVMAGRSDRQVAALVRHIEQGMEQERGARCIGVEGMPRATWVLMDYGDVIVHIFHQDTRGYYDLESLWIDASRVAVDPGA